MGIITDPPGFVIGIRINNIEFLEDIEDFESKDNKSRASETGETSDLVIKGSGSDSLSSVSLGNFFLNYHNKMCVP